jgi:DNA mismatch repair protein MutS
LRTVPTLRDALQQCDAATLAEVGAALDPMPELLDLLERGLADPPGPVLAEGGVIATGWNTELDELRILHSNGTAAIAAFQASEAQRTGIASLKVGYNKVFGYYIEITHAQAAGATIPDDYVRKQTLTSAERYISHELKELETSILTADERSRSLEASLFADLRTRSSQHGESLRTLARAVARLDVLCGFATIADERGWARPVVDDGDTIDIRDGRHPVIEMTLPPGDVVPNDALLDVETARLVLITGPNMSGKSTYIRQVALLVLLAQVGSFVPAASAHIGVVDRIFTRLGSADDLAAGVSTFMLEMTETAAILNSATGRSLVILDEVGRGTSTWDGLSLAWAISEYLYNRVGARTLFATHYHELVDLAEELPAVRNVNVAVREWGEDIVFLHKIVPGGTDRSYGLHVARLAGVPRAVIERAGRILSDLETRSPDLKPGIKEAPAGATGPGSSQGALFPRPAAAVLDEIDALDPDLVSPMEALVLLRRFHGLLGGKVEPSEQGDDGTA